jgi:hypothetical protein
MFKVICIKNSDYLGFGETDYTFTELEIGKMYDADFFGKDKRLYKIYIEEGNFKLHFTKLFLTLAEWRDRQIDLILND